MTRNYDYIIHPPCDPYESIFISSTAISCEVITVLLTKVSLNEPLMVIIDGSHLARPTLADA